MALRKFVLLATLAAFCGCEASKPPEPAKPVAKKNKEEMKGNIATPSEPP